MKNNIIEFRSRKKHEKKIIVNEIDQFTQDDYRLMDYFRELSPGDRKILETTIDIWAESKGDLNKEVEMMKKAGLPVLHIRKCAQLWKTEYANKLSDVNLGKPL